MQTQRIKNITKLGLRKSIDITVDSKDHNFYANNIVVSNCYSYSYITAQTTYLKANYPLEFYLAALKLTKEESKSQQAIAAIEKEMKVTGFKLLPPHLIKSDLDFKIENKGIRFGLGSLRGISDKNFEKLEMFRNTANQDKFSLFQSLKNCGINIGIGSAIVQAGCLEGFGNRSRVVLELAVWSILTDREKTLVLSIGKDVNYDIFAAVLYLVNNKDDKGKPYIKESRFDTIKKKKAKHTMIYELNSKHEKLANYFYERTILGYSYSESITPIYGEKIDDLMTIAQVKKLPNDEFCTFIGFVGDPFKSKTKAKNDCFTMDITDDTETIKVKMFNQKIEYCESSNGRMPEEGDLCVIEGKKVDGDMIFVNRVGIQTTRIFTKLSELKDYKS